MNHWGRSDLMALAAVRYCLGRTSYIVGDCVDWLIEQWPNFSDSIKRTILRDVTEAKKRDDEDRLDGREHKALGSDCDRAEWERFLRFATAKESSAVRTDDEELRRDAEQAELYRFLREDRATEYGAPWCVTRLGSGSDEYALSGEDLDDAIRAALAAEKQEES